MPEMSTHPSSNLDLPAIDHHLILMEGLDGHPLYSCNRCRNPIASPQPSFQRFQGKIRASIYVFRDDERRVGGKERAAANNGAVCGGKCVLQQLQGGARVEVLEMFR
ncbi:hypothetical protein L1987_08904 [Smallanthus sonchifolius]|uniref:Uncharacterized protein n=1 Tax=Smallanthus sonchifolius TaxID=185202 RepID=A0ACB9JN12_9ASTR|nr:hypothetical protein L1987_08904 [Smallanthus sonchifolius]